MEYKVYIMEKRAYITEYRVYITFCYICLQEECEEKLAVAMPALNAAISALDTLKQTDISIVKAMANPPSGVKLVMDG